MSGKQLRIVYMGTPDFAVTSLRALVEGGYNVVAVVTAVDKAAGRGLKLSESSVKKYAQSVGLEVLQPEKLKDEAFISRLKELDIDLGVVVAFRMLPEVVWSMPKYGTFNLHGSLLPDYRGAAPINRAVMNGDKVSGVTTFMLDHKIDTGDIIDFREVSISDDETAGELHDKLMYVGADLVVDTVHAIGKGAVKMKPQREVGELRAAPKIYKETCRISWDEDVDKVYNHIRGLAPYPGAWTDFDGAYGDVTFKITEARKENKEHNYRPSAIVTDGKKTFKVACKGGFIIINKIQLSGKKAMVIEEFLRGNNKMFKTE